MQNATHLRPLTFMIAIAACTLAVAAPAPPPARAEIDALLASLSSSGCEFQRNGSWHNATEARSHLLRKLDYLEKKSLVKRTEDFIEGAASSSSMSGKAYQVRCAGASPVDSGGWMRSQLKAIRGAPAPGAK